MQELLSAILPNANDATRFLIYREENVTCNIGKWQTNSDVVIRILILKNSEQHGLINCKNLFINFTYFSFRYYKSLRILLIFLLSRKILHNLF